MGTKNSYKNFGNMVKEFGSNWKKISDAKNKKEQAIKKALNN